MGWLNKSRELDLVKSQLKIAKNAIYYIANDQIELSHEKVLLQRNDYIKICREALDKIEALACP